MVVEEYLLQSSDYVFCGGCIEAEVPIAILSELP